MGGLPAVLSGHTAFSAPFKDVLEVTLLEAITLHFPMSSYLFSLYWLPPPTLECAEFPVIEKCMEIGRFSAAIAELNKRQIKN